MKKTQPLQTCNKLRWDFTPLMVSEHCFQQRYISIFYLGVLSETFSQRREVINF